MPGKNLSFKLPHTVSNTDLLKEMCSLKHHDSTFFRIGEFSLTVVFHIKTPHLFSHNSHSSFIAASALVYAEFSEGAFGYYWML